MLAWSMGPRHDPPSSKYEMIALYYTMTTERVGLSKFKEVLLFHLHDQALQAAQGQVYEHLTHK